jgi:hypothetical protein
MELPGQCSHAPGNPLEQSDFELLAHPEGPFNARHMGQFRDQFRAARVISPECQNDHPQRRTGRKPENQESCKQGRPCDDLGDQAFHQANRPTRERKRMSCRASQSNAPNSALPLSVSS